MREAIWNHFNARENLSEIELDVTKGDTKSIWEKLSKYLPVYTLFQSDRKNSDGDSEVQDPLKFAVKQILSDEKITQTLDEIAQIVSDKLIEVSKKTLEKIKEMDPEIAQSLKPDIPTKADKLKWTDVFKSVSIVGDENIPINKRGSGVKRLILLSFFRAEAERRISENQQSVIYAIEEPETSQHADNQKKLIDAFKTLSEHTNTQVILTTHSSTVVKELNFKNLRLIKSENGLRKIEEVKPTILPFPSLYEVNYTAFLDITEGYHIELYGHLKAQDKFEDFKSIQPASEAITYQKATQDGKRPAGRPRDIILTEFVRHRIHHPENELSRNYTPEELKKSIGLMRDFISQINSV